MKYVLIVWLAGAGVNGKIALQYPTRDMCVKNYHYIKSNFPMSVFDKKINYKRIRCVRKR
jgi:hypothetical protein